MRPKRGRISLREQIQKNKIASDWLCLMAGKPPIPIEVPPEPRRRAPAKPSGRPLERNTLKAIVQALRLDPRVSRVERNQSGVFQDGNRYIRVGSKGKLDLTVYLKSGRYLELEVKRDSKAKPTEEQIQRIENIRREGGMAGWAWDVPSALALLPA